MPLHKWLLAIHLMGSRKKGMSAHQLMRNLGLGAHLSAWFLCHRIREAMGDDAPASKSGLGGEGKIVENEEAYVGGAGKNRAHSKPAPKKSVVTRIERDGRVASFHVANVTAKTIRPLIMTHGSRVGALMTDESRLDTKRGREFASRQAVDHSRDECAYCDKGPDRGVSINVSENYFGILLGLFLDAT